MTEEQKDTAQVESNTTLPETKHDMIDTTSKQNPE